MKQIALIISTLLIGTTPTFAQFSGEGFGTENSPYLITTADELFEVRNDLTAHYKLMNDLDLTDWLEDNASTYGWSPIGSETSPFNGAFDGNNKCIFNLTINRPTANDIGLFGFSVSATLKNIVLVNPHIEGAENVGGICGRRYSNTDYNVTADAAISISGCHIIGGNITGTNNVGGIIGLLYSYANNTCPTTTLNCNFNSANINGTTNVGGICGTAEFNAGGEVFITDCYSHSRIVGSSQVGGLIGYLHSGWSWLNKIDTGRPPITVSKNAVMGTVKGSDYSNGIIGQTVVDDAWEGMWGNPTIYGEMVISKNACIADTIYGNNRISNNFVNYSDNIAWSKTVVMTNRGAMPVEDDLLNGTSYGTSLLMKKSTFVGLGWDFDSDWSIDEGATYPYHKVQTTIPSNVSFQAGSKGTMSGEESVSNGTVYVLANNIFYSAPVVDYKWNLQLGNIDEGCEAKVFLRGSEKVPSYPIFAYAEAAPIVEPDIKAGDSNGDGVVDVADVVAVINYIAGNASSSFSTANADVNGDGQVLVDDAVAIVKQILNAQ